LLLEVNIFLYFLSFGGFDSDGDELFYGVENGKGYIKIHKTDNQKAEIILTRYQVFIRGKEKKNKYSN
jgi:hypothetical protein